jgi:hypothetical protein
MAQSCRFKRRAYGASPTGLYTNGETPYEPQTTISNINPTSGDPIASTLTYSGTTLSLSTVTGNTFSTQWSNINIPTDVGANTAYVGLTGSLYTAPSTQDATAWTFAN